MFSWRIVAVMSLSVGFCAAGCSLITNVDRNKITAEDGEGGSDAGGEGGTSGASGSSQGGGGTSASTSTEPQEEGGSAGSSTTAPVVGGGAAGSPAASGGHVNDVSGGSPGTAGQGQAGSSLAPTAGVAGT